MKPYVVNFYNSDTGCRIHHIIIDADHSELKISPRTRINLDEHEVLDLTKKNISFMSSRYNFKIDWPFGFAKVSVWSEQKALLYKTHFERELELMLAGEKPLSAFVSVSKDEKDENDPALKYFQKYIIRKQIVKRVYTKRIEGQGGLVVTRTLFSLPDEKWRIDMYITLWNIAEQYGWCSSFSFIENYLLGYADYSKPYEIR